MWTPDFGELDGIAFDMDGVLTDSVMVHGVARDLAFEEMALRHSDERFMKLDPAINAEAHHHGSHPREIIGYVLLKHGIITDLNSPLLDESVELKREFHADMVARGQQELMEGAFQFVEAVYERVGNIVIVTGAYLEQEVRPFLRHSGLDWFFPDKRIVSFEDVGAEHAKPDSLGYRLGLEKLGLAHAPERSVAIEDTWRGIAAAKAAGMQTVALAARPEVVETWPSEHGPLRVATAFSHIGEMCGIITQDGLR